MTNAEDIARGGWPHPRLPHWCWLSQRGAAPPTLSCASRPPGRRPTSSPSRWKPSRPKSRRPASASRWRSILQLQTVPPRHRGARHPARQSRNEHDDDFRDLAADPALRLSQPRLSVQGLRSHDEGHAAVPVGEALHAAVGQGYGDRNPRGRLSRHPRGQSAQSRER